ncbi:MAG TPA: PAS domain S-box protein, partial [Nitrospira sp.]
IAVIWLFAWMISGQRQTWHELAEIEASRTQAETRREAAVAARELAEASAVGAMSRESQTARELLVSSLRLESIIHSAMDAIVTVDERENVVLFNHAAEQIFQCPAREAIGQGLDRFIPARFREVHHRHMRSFGESGETSRRMRALGAVTGLRADGSEFPIEAAISHITIEDKKYYTAIVRDISERAKSEEALKKERNFIGAVLETAGALVLVLDREGRILRFNRACEQATGYSSEEVLGRRLWDFLLPPEESKSVQQIFQRLRGGEPRSDYENHWVAKDRSRRLISWSNTIITDAQGKADFVIAAGIDITLLKDTQDRLRKTERIAELGTLASGMAHEIGTPMNVILGRAEYLMDRVKDEPVKKGLQTIVDQVERITRVMNQLLAFARRKPPERGPLDLRNIVANNLEMFQERLAKTNVLVEMRLEEPCPHVLADADQMSQVVINLVMNAIHAMPNGGTLRIGLSPEREMVKLTVTDSGHGMPREVITQIFEPFFTTKEFGKGTGLGLTVVKGIIEEHQGSIAVESEEGKGTTFTILLPRSEGLG